ncbi:MAG TPA: ABC transporter ATP-binding protein [Candidatus Acidoferrales bacterium]|nr:ABC transporter ATP-binding protein [Candidatus Acidoferrales bacterium]
MAFSLSAELSRLLSYLRPHRRRLGVAIFLMFLVGISEGLTALMIIPAMDKVLDPSLSDSKLTLVRIPFTGRTLMLNSLFPASIHHVWAVFSISLLILFVVKGVSEFFSTSSIQFVGLSAVTTLRNSVYSRLIRQPVGFFEDNPTGRLMSTVISDVERIKGALAEWFADFFRHTFSLFGCAVVLFLIDWKLTLISLVVLPLVIIPVGKLGRRIRHSVQESQSRLADLSQILQETVTGNRVVKAFGMESFEIAKFRETARRLLRENMRWIRAWVANAPLMELLAAIVLCFALLYARDRIKTGVLTKGAFIAFTYALFRVYEPIKRLGGIYHQFMQALGCTPNIFALLDLQEEVQDAPGSVAVTRFSDRIVFDNVSFAYPGGQPILRGIRLEVRAGEVVAIVGASGAGKTTLVNLLPRFYSPTAGRVLMDGHDLSALSLRSLREQFSIVTQETILFNDTVWNNICYGRPGVTEEQVIAAARAALAHDFICEMPAKYQSMIGERGQRLSGGQRQRIAIARALLKDSSVLILDEATSELDSESERLVQQALANLMAGRTVFVIAHRLSTIRSADAILLLDDGQIRERGTHDELLARAGLYARLYELQFGAEALARSRSAGEQA